MNEFSGRQLCALSLCAFCAIAVQYCAAVSWPWVLLAAAIAAIYYIYIGWTGSRIPTHIGLSRMAVQAYGKTGGKFLLGLFWLWTVLATAVTARGSLFAFPEAKSFVVIPAVLLLLAAWAAAKGPSTVCRVGGIHVFPVLALLAGVLAFAASNVKAENLIPSGTLRETAAPLSVFLMPAGALLLREKVNSRGSRCGWWFLTCTALAVGSSLVTTGCLGLPLAQSSEQAFYEMSKSVSVFGVMERFEALTSSAALLARVCLLAFLLVQCGILSQFLIPNAPAWPGPYVSAAAAYGVIWLLPSVSDTLLFWGPVLFWGILPALTLGIVAGKKKAKNP